MNNKLTSALARLNSILPLVKNFRRLDLKAARVHNAILQTYANTGRAPSANELATHHDNIATTLLTLQQLDLIVLDSDGAIRGAYPFSSEPRVHQVTINEQNVHCMCAFDALAISPMFHHTTLIRSPCILSKKNILIQQNNCDIMNPEQCAEIFLAIDWAAASSTTSCADSLCGQMNFIAGSAPAQSWQLQSEQHEIFTLTEAIEFSSRFFTPLLTETQAA